GRRAAALAQAARTGRAAGGGAGRRLPGARATAARRRQRPRPRRDRHGAPTPALRCRRRGAPSGGVPANRPRAERCAPSRDAPLTVGICGGERAWLCFGHDVASGTGIALFHARAIAPLRLAFAISRLSTPARHRVVAWISSA